MSAIVENYSPIYQGDTQKPFSCAFQTTDAYGTIIPLPLTGLTLTMSMSGPGEIVKVCNPANWTIDDVVNGLAHYQWQSSDVDTPGNWLLFIVLTDGSGRVVHADEKPLRIKASI